MLFLTFKDVTVDAIWNAAENVPLALPTNVPLPRLIVLWYTFTPPVVPVIRSPTTMSVEAKELHPSPRILDIMLLEIVKLLAAFAVLTFTPFPP